MIRPALFSIVNWSPNLSYLSDFKKSEMNKVSSSPNSMDMTNLSTKGGLLWSIYFLELSGIFFFYSWKCPWAVRGHYTNKHLTFSFLLSRMAGLVHNTANTKGKEVS